MTWEKGSAKVEMGDEHENIICEWLSSIGYYPIIYRMPNGGAQIKVKKGKTYICPDVEVYLENGHINLKMLVEVKSLSQPSLLNYFDFSRRKKGYPVDDAKNGVGLHQKNFDSYFSIYQDFGYDVRVLFVITESGKWYWEYAKNMNEDKINAGNLFNDGKQCYFWYLSSLRTDFRYK